MLDAKNLLEFEYFPVELPESFSSKDIVKNYDSILGQINATNYKSSVPYLFTVYKSENARRRMAIPNIYHYMKLVQLLIENDSEIQKIYAKSKYSLTKPAEDQFNTDKRAFNRISNNPNETRKRNEQQFQDNSICIKLDISNFFDCIYTHSVVWAIHTKKIAKEKRDDTLWGNKIDKALQGLNDLQTHGLLVGNAASRLIAEIILCNIDEKIEKEFPNISMTRFVDDYPFYIKGGATQEYSVDKIVSFVRTQLLEYDLQLNEAKTKIVEAPFILGLNGIDELKSVVLIDPYNYYNRMLFIYNKYKDSALIKYGLKVLSYKINEENLHSIYPLLLNLWVRFPSLANYILPIIYDNRKSLSVNNKKDLKKVLHTIILNTLSYKQENEAVWAIWSMVVLKLKVTKDILEEINNSSNDLAKIIVFTYLSSENYSYYKTELKKLEIYLIQATEESVEVLTDSTKCDKEDNYILTSHWLLMYELIVKKISNNKTIINYIENNRFFKKLKQLNVDFYHQDIEIEKKEKKGSDKQKEDFSSVLKSILDNKDNDIIVDKEMKKLDRLLNQSSGWNY